MSPFIILKHDYTLTCIDMHCGFSISFGEAWYDCPVIPMGGFLFLFSSTSRLGWATFRSSMYVFKRAKARLSGPRRRSKLKRAEISRPTLLIKILIIYVDLINFRSRTLVKQSLLLGPRLEQC